MARTLPIELISTILSYLPVISLLRFKCVCRSWLDLINSPTFIEQHMSQSKSSKSNRMLVVAGFNTSFYTVDLDTPGSPCVKLRLPEVFNDDRSLRIGGSCNGVMCVYSQAPDSNIMLLNLSTRHYKVIPAFGCTDLVGLGFDHVNSDFKIFRTYQCAEIINGNELSLTKQSAVYSSRNDSWTQCDELEDTYLGRDSGVLVESHLLHWIPKGSHSIVCFDVCGESWSEVPLPHYDLSNSVSSAHYGTDFYLMLGELYGRLCLYTNKYDVTNIWIMKEYGVAESWSQLLGLSNSVITKSLTDLAVTYSNEGGHILVLDSFFWYDFRENAIRDVTIQGIPSYKGVALCWNTLVDFIGGVPMDNQIE